MTRFDPPPYPHDRLAGVRRRAAAAAGDEMVDLSVGNPGDPLPEVVAEALRAHLDTGVGYPASIGSARVREAAVGWMGRRLGVVLEPTDVIACVGTKEVVASLPRMLSLREPERDTVLYPAVAYPTYAMGAMLAGLRAVPVRTDHEWRPDLSTVAPADARRALLLWLNQPGNPTGSVADEAWYREAVAWARRHGIVVASDECYAEFTYDRPPSTALVAGRDGVLAVHSLSKRSNMAGLRVGFVAGDSELVAYLGEVRKHAGLMVPGPVQMAAAAALDDDEHVEEQRARYAKRREAFLACLTPTGLRHTGGPATFYLWLRHDDGRDAWALAADLAGAGVVGAPGDFYGEDPALHVRVALVEPLERLEPVLARIAARFRP